MIRAQLTIAAVLVVFVLGFFIGRFTAPQPEASPAGAVAQLPEPNQRALDALDDFEAESDLGIGDRAQVGLARTLLEMGTPPSELMGEFIDRMRDDELIGIMESFTNFTKDDFEDVRDVRGYVRQLSEIAMEGVLQEESSDTADARTVVFSESISSGNQPQAPQEIFGTNAKRIYATFPTDDYEGSGVIAKWYTKNPPNLVLFGEYPISNRDDNSYVWLEKKTGWNPGDYTVQIYSKDGERVLAVGQLAISENAN